MSQLVDRIRNWWPQDRERQKLQQLKDEVEGKTKKRRPFKGQVLRPWYSMRRGGNIFLLAVVGICFMFWPGLVMMKKSIVYDLRLRAERKRFLKQLDEEERVLEQQAAAGAGQT